MVDGKHLGEHPDENLLSAFAEHALTSSERERVVGHLSTCARCRDVVFLAQQAFLETEPSEVAPPRSVVMGWGWRWWGPVGAGVLAVLLIAVPIAVHRHRNRVMLSAPEQIAAAPPEPSPRGDSLSPVRPAPVEPAARRAVKSSPSAAAVKGNGEIAGSVADRSGAAVPGAHVTVRAASSGAARTAVTNPQGQFDVAALPSGTYQVQVEAQGFQTLTREMTVLPSERASLDAKLDVGAASQTVTVSAANAAAADALVSGVAGGTASGAMIANRNAANVPLNGRSIVPAAPPAASPRPPVTASAPSPPATAGLIVSGSGVAPVATFAVKDGVVQRCIGTECAERILPLGARAVSVAAGGQTVMALDADGDVFLSTDQGEHWTRAQVQWEGKAVAVRVNEAAFRGAFLRLSPGVSSATRSHGATTTNGAAASQLVRAIFELTNDKGQVWVSSDGGKTWTTK